MAEQRTFIFDGPGGSLNIGAVAWAGAPMNGWTKRPEVDAQLGLPEPASSDPKESDGG